MVNENATALGWKKLWDGLTLQLQHALSLESLPGSSFLQ